MNLFFFLSLFFLFLGLVPSVAAEKKTCRRRGPYPAHALHVRDAQTFETFRAEFSRHPEHFYLVDDCAEPHELGDRQDGVAVVLHPPFFLPASARRRLGEVGAGAEKGWACALNGPVPCDPGAAARAGRAHLLAMVGHHEAWRVELLLRRNAFRKKLPTFLVRVTDASPRARNLRLATGHSAASHRLVWMLGSKPMGDCPPVEANFPFEVEEALEFC